MYRWCRRLYQALAACAAVASTALAASAGFAAYPIENILSVAAQSSQTIVANRNSQIATTYVKDAGPGLPNHVFEYGSGLIGDFAQVGVRYLALDISNWGVVMVNDGQGSTQIVSGAIGVPPAQVFNPGANGLTNLAEINDAGKIVFSSSVSGQTGAPDVFTLLPGGAAQKLPSLNASNLYTTLVDESGQPIVHLEFQSPFREEIYGYDSMNSWTALTLGKLPAATTVASTTAVNGTRIISANGDFVFPGQRKLADGHVRWEVMLYDKSAGTILSIMDQSSTFTEFNGNPLTIDAIATIGDEGQVWIAASRYSASLPAEFKSLYRNADGSVVDLGALLPTGYSLVDEKFLSTMNFKGDLWFAAVNNSTGRYNYYLYSRGAVRPIIQDSALQIYRPVLTNSLDVYFWSDGNSASQLERIHAVAEPASGALGSLAILWVLTFATAARKQVGTLKGVRTFFLTRRSSRG